MFPLDCAISLLLPAWRKKFGSGDRVCAVFQRFAQEAAHEKAGWMGRCIGAGLAVPAGRSGRGFPLLPADGADERTGHGGGMPRGGGGARPALCRRLRADAAAAGGVVAGAPPAADGRSPRGKNRGLRAGVRRLAGGERVRRGARVGLCARRKGRGCGVSGQPWERHRGGAVLALWRGPRPGGLRRAGRIRRRGGGQPALLAADGRRALRGTFYHGRALHRPGARGRGGASAANPRRFGGAKPGKRGGKTCQQRKNCV